MDRIATLRVLLEEALTPTHLSIIDDSAKHIGHAGAANGAGHYRIQISSPRFQGLGLRARHQLVYEAVAHMIGDEIHALSIEAKLP